MAVIAILEAIERFITTKMTKTKYASLENVTSCTFVLAPNVVNCFKIYAA